MTARVLFALVCYLLAVDVNAQEPACPRGNLLRDRSPSLYDGIERVAAITDGARAHEGAFWNTPVTGVLDSESSFLVYDLGRLVQVDELYVLESAMIGLLLIYVLGSEVIRVWRQQMQSDAPR